MNQNRALELLRICTTDADEASRQAAWDEFWYKLPHPKESARNYHQTEVERARWQYIDRISDPAMIELTFDDVLQWARERVSPDYVGTGTRFELQSVHQFLSFVRERLRGELRTRRKRQPVSLETLAGADLSSASVLSAPDEGPEQGLRPVAAAPLLEYLVQRFEAYLTNARRAAVLSHFRRLRTAVAVVTGEDSESSETTLERVFCLLNTREGGHWHWPKLNALMREVTGQDPSQNNKRLGALYRQFLDSPAGAAALREAREAARLVEARSIAHGDAVAETAGIAARPGPQALSPVKDWVRWSHVDALFDEIEGFLVDNEPPDQTVLFLKHTPRQDAFVRALLGLVKARLTHLGLRVAVYDNPLQLALTCEKGNDACSSPVAGDILLLPDIDRFPELPLFRDELLAGHRVLATATADAWRRDYPWECVLERDITAAGALPDPQPVAKHDAYLECVQAGGLLGAFVQWTAAFFAWNWPLPVSLAARLLETDTARLLQLVDDTQGLLYCTDLSGDRSSPAVVTESAWAARDVFATQVQRSGVEGFHDQMVAALQACQTSGERLVVGSVLFRVLTVGGYKYPELGGVRGVRGILRSYCAQHDFSAILRQALVSEIRLWARIWAAVHAYPAALDILDAALARGSEHFNPGAWAALHRDRAGLLARWAETDDAQYAAARQALEESRAGGAEFDLQQATLELKLGHYPESLMHLDHALQWLDSAWGRERPARSASLRRAVLVTRANCHLEWPRGKHAIALKSLDEAEHVELAYAQHVRAKAEYYAGQFDVAMRRLEPLLALPYAAMTARNLQGTIALHRGHLQQAREAFESNLAVYPESLPDLMSNAELDAARGDLARQRQQQDSANMEYERAEQWLRQILEIQPVNFRAAVALGTLYARWANLNPRFVSQAEQVLCDAVRAHPSVGPRAWHALAQLHLRHKDWEDYGRWRRNPAVRDALRQVRDQRSIVWLLHDLEIGLRPRDPDVVRDRCLDLDRELQRAAQAYQPDGHCDQKLPVHEIIHGYNAAARLLLDHHGAPELAAENLLARAAHFVAAADALDPPSKNAYTAALQADLRAAQPGADAGEMQRRRTGE